MSPVPQARFVISFLPCTIQLDRVSAIALRQFAFWFFASSAPTLSVSPLAPTRILFRPAQELMINLHDGVWAIFTSSYIHVAAPSNAYGIVGRCPDPITIVSKRQSFARLVPQHQGESDLRPLKSEVRSALYKSNKSPCRPRSMVPAFHPSPSAIENKENDPTNMAVRISSRLYVGLNCTTVGARCFFKFNGNEPDYRYMACVCRGPVLGKPIQTFSHT